MFKLNERYEVDRRILKCEFIRCTPNEISTINTANFQIYVIITREDCLISLLKGYLDLNLDVLQAATKNRIADGDNIRLINLAVIGLFSNFKLTSNSGKH